MVASNPLFHSQGAISGLSKKFRATVINDIWPEVLFFTLVGASAWTFHFDVLANIETHFTALVVSLVSHYTSTQLVVSNGILTVLGTVLGLVISFRTSTAYERCATSFQEREIAQR